MRRAIATALALSVVMSGGCGDAKTDVEGKVTYQGKTVVWGTVTLVDADGAYHQSPIDLEGNYKIAGVPSGPVKIGVHSINPFPRGNKPKPGGRGNANANGGGIPDPRANIQQNQAAELPRPEPGQWFPLPDTVSDPQTSGLTGTVSSGEPLDIVIP